MACIEYTGEENSGFETEKDNIFLFFEANAAKRKKANLGGLLDPSLATILLSIYLLKIFKRQTNNTTVLQMRLKAKAQ